MLQRRAGGGIDRVGQGNGDRLVIFVGGIVGDGEIYSLYRLAGSEGQGARRKPVVLAAARRRTAGDRVLEGYRQSGFL